MIDIIEITLPISVWITLLLLCAPILKRSYVSKWRYYMWLFVAARLVLPFKISIAKPITMPIPQAIPTAAQTPVVSAAGIDVQKLVTFIWILGVIVFVLYQTAKYISFSGMVRRWAKNVTDERILKAVKAAKDFAGVTRGFNVKFCKAVTTPMVFGIVKPVLLLPCIDLTDAELTIVLRHELVHMKRRDIWYKLLVMTARAVHWFNPMVHIMASAADRDMEFACDAEVVRSQNADYRRGYCETIMRLVHNGRGRGTALSTCFFFSKKTVMDRFKGILDEKIKRNGIVMFCVIAVSVAVSGGVITFATDSVAEVIEDDLGIVERPTPPPAPTPEPTAEPQPVYEDDTDDTYYEPESDGTDDYVYEDYTVPEYEDYVPEEPEYTDNGVNDITIGDERGSVYDRLGEPESSAANGMKDTYSLDDGSTAVLQYEDGTLEHVYIVEPSGGDADTDSTDVTADGAETTEE